MALLDLVYKPIAKATADYLRSQAKTDLEKSQAVESSGQVGRMIRRNAIDQRINDQNMRRKPGGDIPFETLRRFSRTHEISRICINARKRQITSLGWDIVAADPEDKTDYSKDIDLVKAYFKNMGGYRMRFNKLQDTLIEDLLVLDAMVLYKQRDRRGNIMYYMPVDGSTIKLRVDPSGNTPEPPEVAYVQYIRGQVMGEYTADQMMYELMNPRTDTPYGLAPLESLIMVVTSALKSSLYNLDFLTSGNIPEGLLTMPENWSVKQIEEYMTYFDALVAGNSGETAKMKPMPGGSTFTETHKRSDMAFAEFNNWLMQITCAMFDIQPQEIGFTMNVNKANGSEQNDITTRKGILPLCNLLTEMWNDAIQIDLGFPFLKFAYLGLEDRDQLMEAQANQTKLAAGYVTIDEVRKEEGLDPLGINMPYILGTPTLLTEDYIKNGGVLPTMADGNGPSATEAHASTTAESGDSELIPGKAVEPEITKAIEVIPPPVEPIDKPEEQHIALVNELKTFEKYATKRIKSGKSLRKFESDVLPSELVDDINKRLDGADVPTVKAVFKEYKEDYQINFLEDVVKLKSDLKAILE